MTAGERMTTVKTLAEVPGAYDRGIKELQRLLRIKHGVRFVIGDERQPRDRIAPADHRADADDRLLSVDEAADMLQISAQSDDRPSERRRLDEARRAM